MGLRGSRPMQKPSAQEPRKKPQETVWDSVTMAIQEIVSNQRLHDVDDVEKYAVEEVMKLARTAANAAVKKIQAEREREARMRNFDRRQQAQSSPVEEMQRANEALKILRGRLLFLELVRIAGEENATRPAKFQSLRRVGEQAIALPFTKKKELGKGAYGVVYSAVDKNGFEFAVKEVPLSGVEEDSIREEVKILNKLSHENIVSCYGCAGDEENIYMFMELMKGSLHDEMTRLDKPLAVNMASKFTKCLLKGLVYLHSKGIVHRDIKCANVLLDAKGNVKLADMGISKKHDEETLLQYERKAGTLFWMSPETISDRQSGRRSDVWAVGCTVYEMVKQYPPFYEKLIRNPLLIPLNLPPLIIKIVHRELVNEDDTLPPALQNFLARIFVKMEERPYAESLTDHPWIR